MQSVKEGFASLSVPEVHKHAALQHLALWLNQSTFAEYQPQIHALIAAKKWSLLLDSFYQMIPFGTGGRRGSVGIGPNRINPYTIATSVQGHIAFLRQMFATNDLSVVIAYDVREFRDLKGNYIAEVANPLLGLRSKDLCHLAVEVYAAHGVRSYVLSPDQNTYLSTPELSFLIRAYQTQGGLNISASHNHPDDNGGKFYNEHGGQPIPPADQEMLDLVAQVEDVKKLTFAEAVQQGYVSWITDDKRKQYMEANLKLVQGYPVQPVRVAYTPMHGTGSTSVVPLLQAVGHDVHTLPSQQAFDGAFSHVRYRMPNPEVREAMQDLIDYAASMSADIALATDPDADRIGMVAPDTTGRWRFFTGNEIAVLLTHHRLHTLKQRNQLANQPIVVKTEVTTDLIRKITEAFDGVCLGGLLVGFKYIGAALRCWEIHESYLGVSGSLEQFVIGSEESHGILLTPEIRDKDAAGAALLLAELASHCRENQDNVCDYLMRIYRTHGYFCNDLRSLVMEGAVGISNIRDMQMALRNHPPSHIAGVAVTKFVDFWDESGSFGPIVSETDRSSRNVLSFALENGARMVLRPSGTEPKAKLYIEVSTSPLQKHDDFDTIVRQANQQAQKLADAFIQMALQSIGMNIPLYALATSDILSLDKKQKFGEILPRWVESIQREGTQLQPEAYPRSAAELAQQLSRISPQPKGLLSAGLTRYLEQHTIEKQIQQKLLDIWQLLP